MNDTISDLVNRINNAKMAGNDQAKAPFSNLKMAILSVLQEEGYVSGFKKHSGQIEINLADARKMFTRIKRISTPGRRIYSKAKKIPSPKGGFGEVIISTPRGVLSGRKARKIGAGGELICEIY